MVLLRRGIATDKYRSLGNQSGRKDTWLRSSTIARDTVYGISRCTTETAWVCRRWWSQRNRSDNERYHSQPLRFDKWLLWSSKTQGNLDLSRLKRIRIHWGALPSLVCAGAPLKCSPMRSHRYLSPSHCCWVFSKVGLCFFSPKRPYLSNRTRDKSTLCSWILGCSWGWTRRSKMDKWLTPPPFPCQVLQ